MSEQKVWNVMFVRGNPRIFSKVCIQSGSPMKRGDAMSAFNRISSFGWRTWVEHAQTGRRIAESEAEKLWQSGLHQCNKERYLGKRNTG